MDIKVAEVMEYLVSGRSKDGYSSVSECVEHMSNVINTFEDCLNPTTIIAEHKEEDGVISINASEGKILKSLDNASSYCVNSNLFIPDVCGFYDVREELKHNFIQHIVSDITFENAVIDAIDNFNQLGLTFCVICIKDVFYIVSPDFEAVVYNNGHEDVTIPVYPIEFEKDAEPQVRGKKENA